MTRALICIPTYNERDNIPKLMELLEQYRVPEMEILFIDDNSPDGSGDLIREISLEKPHVHGLHRRGKEGLAAAYLAGFEWALEKGYDWVFEMDADLSHPASALPHFWKEIQKGEADFLVASRYVEGGGVSDWNPFRVLISMMASVYTSFWLRHELSDWTGGFNAWSKDCLSSMALDRLRSRGYTFQIELKYRALSKEKRFREIPIVFSERIHGQSKFTGSIINEAIWSVIHLRWLWQSDRLY